MLCPKCNQEKHCAIEAGKNPYHCWCMEYYIPNKVRQKMIDADYASCLCEACIKELLEDFNKSI